MLRLPRLQPQACPDLTRFDMVDSASLKHGSWPYASIGRRFLPPIKFVIGASVLFLTVGSGLSAFGGRDRTVRGPGRPLYRMAALYNET